MIASGCKTEEYREIKHYWTVRLVPNRYDAILFRNGYSKNAPRIIVELKDIFVGVGNKAWGAPTERVFIIRLGRILEGRYGKTDLYEKRVEGRYFPRMG